MDASRWRSLNELGHTPVALWDWGLGAFCFWPKAVANALGLGSAAGSVARPDPVEGAPQSGWGQWKKFICIKTTRWTWHIESLFGGFQALRGVSLTFGELYTGGGVRNKTALLGHIYKFKFEFWIVYTTMHQSPLLESACGQQLFLPSLLPSFFLVTFIRYTERMWGNSLWSRRRRWILK